MTALRVVRRPVVRYQRGVYATYAPWERWAMAAIVVVGLTVLAAVMSGVWPR